MKSETTTSREGADCSPPHTPAKAAVALSLIPLTGCRGAPSIDVLGSFFPGWMFCMLAGLIGTLVARAILARTRIEPQLRPRALVYLCLWGLLSLGQWILFFRN